MFLFTPLMSESAAKQERRDLRRAFGERAIGVIDTHGAAILGLTQNQDRIAASLDLSHKRHDQQHAAFAPVQEWQQAFARRSFRERWRWLFFGR
jgi:hypothetical protein